jgi:HSP20 family molecular chaperone IbpA
VLETVTAREHITGRDRVPPGPDLEGRFAKGSDMTRVSFFSNPLLLGFGEFERLLERASKNSGDGYPPYNIERSPGREGESERFRITLALAGFNRDELEITVEENQLIIRGGQKDEEQRSYLHRGIAARQFQRAFVLADGMEVKDAVLENGLLTIDLERREPERIVRRIEIKGA